MKWQQDDNLSCLRLLFDDDRRRALGYVITRKKPKTNYVYAEGYICALSGDEIVTYLHLCNSVGEVDPERVREVERRVEQAVLAETEGETE